MRKRFFLPECPAPAGRNGSPQFGSDKPWLAPLAGYSDLAFRILCREYGAATCETEMISARGLAYQSPGTGELLASAPCDQPLVAQLFGGDAESMGLAAKILHDAGYLWLDCNMGCPVRKVMRQNAGAALLADPGLALKIAEAMIAAVRASGSGGVGFKLRLGVSPEKPVLPDLALRLEDAGASWITLHPRYASEGFGGRAHWESLAALSGRLDIPLIASGDLLEASDGISCLAQTGASGVMYARGALKNPFIFRQHLALCAGLAQPLLEHAQLRRIIERHLELAREFCDNKKAVFKMRSIAPRYVRNLQGVHNLRLALCQCRDWEQLADILDDFLAAAASQGLRPGFEEKTWK